MPRVNGIYQLPPGYFAVSGEVIQVSQHNPPLEDLAAAMTDSLPRDGTAGMTGNLPMGGNRITGLGEPTAGNHAARLADVNERLPLTGGVLTGWIRAVAGDEETPGVQFGNANNGIYWLPGTGPRFTSGGQTIGILDRSMILYSDHSIVTRVTGDLRYVQQSRSINTGSGLSGGGDLSGDLSLALDSTVLRTNSEQSITRTKTISTATATLVFNADGNARNSISFNRGGGADVWMRHEANGDLNIITNSGRSVQVDGSDIVTQSDIATVAEARAGTANNKMMTPLRVAQTVLGVNQSWVDVTGSRSANTVYQNTTGRAIEFLVSTTNHPIYLMIGQSPGSLIALLEDEYNVNISVIVPAGHYYEVRFNPGSVGSIKKWSELR